MNYNDYWTILCAMRLLKEYAGQVLNPACERSGITPVQVHLLMSLHFEGPQPAGSLARSCCMAGANASVMCKRLEGMGLLRRQRDPRDERQVIISLTRKGARVAEGILEELSGHLAAMPLELDARDAQLMEEGTGRLAAILKENAATQAAMEEKE